MSGEDLPRMSSNRPYLLRALYEWIADNGMTPYLLVDAAAPGLQVPASAVRDGRVVLNIAARAVVQLEMGNADIRFMARFGGVSHAIRVPVGAVLAIYAQETGQGMALPEVGAGDSVGSDDEPSGDPEPTSPAPTPEAPKRSHLKVIK